MAVWRQATTAVTTKMRVAITSGKGGTGKTTLAVNLAHYLAKKHDTLLADLDVEEPNCHVFIKGKLQQKEVAKRMVPGWNIRACSMCGKCITWCRFNSLIRLGNTILVLPELCHSCYLCSELCPDAALPMQAFPLGKLSRIKDGELDFLEARMEIGVEQASPLIGQALDYADKHFPGKEFQLLDSPPGTSCSMIAATKTADFAILVTEPTPFGLHDLSLAVETLRQLQIPIAVVINRSGANDGIIEEYCSREDIPIWSKIPHLRKIAGLYSEGQLLFEQVPELQQSLDEIIAKLEELS